MIRVQSFKKTFYAGLRRRPSEAARKIDLHVERGEVFGFLGPNGAGKTTTIKALLGLIRPDSGELFLHGTPVATGDWRRKTGYLPEHPNFYEYLTGFELVTWFGQLAGLSRHDSETQAQRQLARVKLSHAMHRRLRSYSKGMIQRAGIAQALMADPTLLILDEPMTGLDPIGRRDMRELLLELRGEGRTIFYSTHILSDVEATCDRVAIVDKGETRQVATVGELLAQSDGTISVRLDAVPNGVFETLPPAARTIKRGADWFEAQFPDVDVARAFVTSATAAGAQLSAFVPNREDLEALFVRTLRSTGDAPERGSP